MWFRNQIEKRREIVKERKEIEKILITYPVFQLSIDSNIVIPVKKALHLEQLKEEYELCISQRICPKCGGVLLKKEWNNDNRFLTKYYEFLFCDICKKHTEVTRG